MKTIRVKMTPTRMERLLDGKPVRFKALNLGADPDLEIELVLEDDSDAWAKFDEIFKKIIDKVDKVTSAILK
jgi:hypothetical protein